MNRSQGKLLFFCFLLNVYLSTQYTIFNIKSTSVTIRTFGNAKSVYYCRCVAECYTFGRTNYDRINIDNDSDRIVTGLRQNTQYCFFDDLTLRTIDVRVKTAPEYPENFQILQTNSVSNPTSLRASWTEGMPNAEGYTLIYRIIRRNAVTLTEIDRVVISTSVQLFTATLDSVVLYDIQASNLDTEPTSGAVIFSTPITVPVAIPSPPQIVAVMFTTSTASIAIAKVSTLYAITTVICAGAVCTTITSGTTATIPWTANTRQTITAANIYNSDYSSVPDTLIEVSPPLTATGGNFSVFNSTTILLQWVQPPSGTLNMVWLVTVKNSSKQVTVSVAPTSATSFPFPFQPGFVYYAEISTFNGYKNSSSSLQIYFGTAPLSPTIQSFQVSPLLSTVFISHVREANQSIFYTYTWKHAITQQILNSINSTQMTVMWNHQGNHFGTPMFVQVTATNDFGVSNITQLTLSAQSTSVTITTISEGVYSFKVIHNKVTPIQNYYVMIKDGTNILATYSSATNHTFILVTLPPVTSCSILTAISFSVNNRLVTSIASLHNSSFITTPLAMISFSLIQRNETSFLFSYKDHPNNPIPHSIRIQLLDFSNSSIVLYQSNSLQIVNITASSKYYAAITLYYQYQQYNTLPTNLLVTTPPLPPQYVESEFLSNDYFVLRWRPPSEGSFDISYYNISVWIQNSVAPAVLTTNILTNETQWEATQLIPNTKYTIQVFSINSESVSSIRTLNYEFYSYPTNPIYQKTVYADYLILKWQMPVTVHPSLVSFSYIIVYHLQSNIAQNKTITFKRNYQSVAEVVYAILNLNPLQIYVFNILTTAHYKNGVNMTCDFGSADQAITTKADPPSSSPTIYPIDTDYVTTNSFVVTWDTISTTLNAKLHYFTIYLNYSEGGEFISKETQYLINSEEATYSTVVMDLPAATTFLVSITGSNIGGSSPLSNIVTVTTKGATSNDFIKTIVPSIIVPIISICILICIISFVILFVVIVFFIRIQSNKKKIKIDSNYEMKEVVKQYVSKEFKIDEKNIDLKGSQFIGSGVSGSVVTAKFFNIDVAVKIIQKSKTGNEAELRDFYNELQFLNSNTQHLNVIRFFGVYENSAKNHIGLVMELCTNGSVANYIVKHSNLSFSLKLQMIQGIANGMFYLHHHNIAHRDLKCENVLLDSNLIPKIIDFGFSRIISEHANQSLNLTMNIGTAAYCAPEVIKMQTMGIVNHQEETSFNQKKIAYDKSCDVYSFAILIYAIYFQQKNPYGEVPANQILYQLVSNPDFRPKIDETCIPENEKWLIELMKQCWRTNPDERPSFEQICNLLNQKVVPLNEMTHN